MTSRHKADLNAIKKREKNLPQSPNTDLEKCSAFYCVGMSAQSARQGVVGEKKAFICQVSLAK